MMSVSACGVGIAGWLSIEAKHDFPMVFRRIPRGLRPLIERFPDIWTGQMNSQIGSRVPRVQKLVFQADRRFLEVREPDADCVSENPSESVGKSSENPVFHVSRRNYFSSFFIVKYLSVEIFLLNLRMLIISLWIEIVVRHPRQSGPCVFALNCRKVIGKRHIFR